MKLTNLVLAATLVLTPAALMAQTGQSIQNRKYDQQSRIAGGDRSGQLTRGETRHLRTQERGINREERAMRAQDNGHLTRGDRALINRQQNQESNRIYRDKHNARVR